MMRSYYAGILTGVICTALVLYILCTNVFYDDSELSCRSTSVNGSRLLCALLGKLGCPGEIQRTAIKKVPSSCRSLLILSPVTEIEAQEVQALIEAVEGGGTVVLADRKENGLFRRLGIAVFESGNDMKTAERSPIPGSFTAGAEKVRYSSSARMKFKKDIPREILLIDERGVIAAALSMGKGHLVVLSAPEMLSNEMLGEADNSIFAVRLASHGGKGRIIFDEYHHGTSAGLSLAAKAGIPVRFLVIQLLIVAFFYILGRGRRFYPVLPRSQMRKSIESLDAVAHLLQRAEARAYSLSLIYGHFKRKCSRRGGCSAESDNAVIAGACGQGGGEAGLLSLMNRCEKEIKSGRLNDEGLLRLTAQIENCEKGDCYGRYDGTGIKRD